VKPIEQIAYDGSLRGPLSRHGLLTHAGSRIMNDNVFIDTILEAQAILARHIAGEHASAEETIAKLMQLLDSSELVKALAKRGFSSKALE
jgi:hypothetical protein